MAIDKKSGLDVIAKRTPHRDVFNGVLGEHHANPRSYASWVCPKINRGKSRRKVALWRVAYKSTMPRG